MRCFALVMAGLAVTVSASVAQGRPATPQPAQGRPATPQPDSAAKAALPEKPSQRTLTELVRYSDDKPVRGATVLLSPPGVGSRGRMATTDSTGRFTIDSLPEGQYTLQVIYPGASRPDSQRIVFDGKGIDGHVVVRAAPEPSIRYTVACLLVYLATIVLVRWNNIARSIDEMLKGQLHALSTRIDTETGPDKAEEKKRLKDTIVEIKRDFRVGEGWKWFWRPWEFLFWSRGRENAAWVASHEVERQLAAFLAPQERVVSYLQLTHAQLRVINDPPAIAIADAISASLEAKPDPAQNATREEERRSLLGRAIALVYEDRDKQFSTLMEWHNKASWLILAAIVIIGFLSFRAGHAILFLAGAAGGFLSRVMRALRREDLPLDYGASWTTLFLSPLFGALAAWFGVAIITLATQPNVKLLGDAFDVVEWDTPHAAATLAVAFILGFSERFFDAVVGAVETHGATAEAAEKAAKGPAGPKLADRPAPPVVKATLDLPEGNVPVQTLRGKVLLEKPATADTSVTIKTDSEEFVPTPDTLTIPAGDLEATFTIEPKDHAQAAVVQVTVQVGNDKLSRAIKFG
jgi:hypothetical protein